MTRELEVPIEDHEMGHGRMSIPDAIEQENMIGSCFKVDVNDIRPFIR